MIVTIILLVVFVIFMMMLKSGSDFDDQMDFNNKE